ncbi:MAG: class I tRNA ligase family protein, partial [Clostridia bacterium]|nr:class I tRNA ligase family protein [Clostridia bacterium]
IFPHHENEIAQSEGATGKPFARYWLHNAFLNIDNQKMSKSLGNFFTVRDASQHYDYEIIRFFMLSAHYRSPINYSAEQLEQAGNALNRLYECKRNLNFLIDNAAPGEDAADGDFEKLLAYKDKFIEAMEDDLNTADAVSAIFELVRDVNILTSSAPRSKAFLEKALGLFNELTGILGIVQKEEDTLAQEVESLIAERQQARKEKNWKLSDEIRDKLKAMGIELQDTPQGVKWKKV